MKQDLSIVDILLIMKMEILMNREYMAYSG